MPVSLSPTSSHARAIPMMSNAIRRSQSSSAALLLRGLCRSLMPDSSSNANVASRTAMNPSCCGQ